MHNNMQHPLQLPLSFRFIPLRQNPMQNTGVHVQLRTACPNGIVQPQPRPPPPPPPSWANQRQPTPVSQFGQHRPQFTPVQLTPPIRNDLPSQINDPKGRQNIFLLGEVVSPPIIHPNSPIYSDPRYPEISQIVALCEFQKSTLVNLKLELQHQTEQRENLMQKNLQLKAELKRSKEDLRASNMVLGRSQQNLAELSAKQNEMEEQFQKTKDLLRNSDDRHFKALLKNEKSIQYLLASNSTLTKEKTEIERELAEMKKENENLTAQLNEASKLPTRERFAQISDAAAALSETMEGLESSEQISHSIFAQIDNNSLVKIE